MANNGYKILDSDMHVFEPHDLYLNYMNPKWGDRIPRGQPRTKHGQTKFSLADGRPLRPSGTQALAATAPKKDSAESSPGEAAVAHRYAKPLARGYDAVSQLAAMDEEGLDVAVLFRTFPLHCDDSLEAEYANDLCRAWNNWMADFCKADPRRLRPSALITLHDVDMAVDETRRAIQQLGAIGICLVPEPANGRHIHDRCYDPLWREAEKLGAPVCFHPAASPNQEQAVHRFKGHANEAVLINAFRNPIELMLAVGSFCAGGVLERFPNLRVAFLEGNCAWLPWVLYRLDERWDMRQGYCNEPMSRRPSDYFLRQCYVSVDVEEDLVTDVVKRLGDDNLVVSTDYPHADSHWPRAMADFFRIDLPDQARRKILWDNCARLYGVS
ncbi:MAG TPA: amidohydrolase family protein [Terriglobales bacterium]|jgi:predicted TIM-barrel fold metal-dependent hydrolase|nr:amidohydrolase family protein [Terriglobales bacterium]